MIRKTIRLARLGLLVLLTLGAVGTAAAWTVTIPRDIYGEPTRQLKYALWKTDSTFLEVSTALGRVQVLRFMLEQETREFSAICEFGSGLMAITEYTANSGYGYDYERQRTGLHIYRIIFPVWLLVGALATYPAIAFIRGPLRTWQRRRKGLCITCGYDLTGNVTGTCPECGTGKSRRDERK